MTIDEAIKIKLQWRKDNYPPALPDEMNADKLSIEALEALKKDNELIWKFEDWIHTWARSIEEMPEWKEFITALQAQKRLSCS